MAAPSPENVGKVDVQCPHCAGTQLESAFARSTFCKSCRQHFDILKPGEHPSPEKSNWLLARVSALVTRETNRQIRCAHCGAEQTVSTSAKSSICPQCTAYIDLTDLKISTIFSRSIDTQGVVTITAKGEISNSTVTCGEAWLYGKLRGRLVCSGTAHVKLKGQVLGTLEAHHLLIEKGANVEFVRPVKVGSAEILGRVSARIMADGVVSIRKSGALEGAVFSKGIIVDKGGLFSGELSIGSHEAEQPELSGEGAGLFGDDLALGSA